MDPRKAFGNQSEHVAESFLEKKGLRLRARQYRCAFGEIDLIMEDGETLVFVEVKARHDDGYGYPEEAVTPGKLAKIRTTAEEYIAQCHIPDTTPRRIDVVAIRFLPTTFEPEIVHFEGVE